jgi:hypothetical protein
MRRVRILLLAFKGSGLVDLGIASDNPVYRNQSDRPRQGQQQHLH